GTTAGVMMAPTLVPALKIPVASARSLRGNHSATVLIDAGKLPDSPRPSRNLAARKPATDAEYLRPITESRAATGGPNSVALAVAIAATDQTVSASAYPFFVQKMSITQPANRNPLAEASWKAKARSPS